MRWLLLVNGPPGSGKSTLARALARELAMPLLSKDAVKETLLDELGYADRQASRRIGAASGEVLWTLAGESPFPVIVESWLAPSTRGIVRAGLQRASIDTVVEIWCACPPEAVRQRYADRQRHPGHFDEALLPDLDAVIATAEPLALGPVIEVRTDAPPDVADVVARVRATLPMPAVPEAKQ